MKILHVEAEQAWWRRIWFARSRRGPRRTSPIRSRRPARPRKRRRRPEIARASGANVAARDRRGSAARVRSRGRRLGLGAVDRRRRSSSSWSSDAPCHVAIMKAPTRSRRRTSGILVPVDGSVASRLAVDLALRYAEATRRRLTLAVMTERRPQAAAYADVERHARLVEDARPATKSWSASRSSSAPPTFKPSIMHLAFDPRSSAVAETVEKGNYDLVVAGGREPGHPAPAVLRLRERAPDPRHARAGAGGRPQPGKLGAQRRATRCRFDAPPGEATVGRPWPPRSSTSSSRASTSRGPLSFTASFSTGTWSSNASPTYMKLDAEEGPAPAGSAPSGQRRSGCAIAVDDLESKLTEIEAAGGRILVRAPVRGRRGDRPRRSRRQRGGDLERKGAAGKVAGAAAAPKSRPPSPSSRPPPATAKRQ